ncbi:MAG: type II toxin-antitoxin system VapC family toxin [Betaproteobacteria bacterium]|nr:type II toxin-antitoxin system VapC family toxin [Betaproteobacteria bacterium]
MRLLIDTHLLLWWLAGGVRLPRRARGFLADTSNQVFFSAASIWEVSIKAALGKIEADSNEMLVALRSGGFEELPVTGRHASAVMRLPDHHRDPFDRMLVAQSLVESLVLLTDDRVLSKYGATVIVTI